MSSSSYSLEHTTEPSAISNLRLPNYQPMLLMMLFFSAGILFDRNFDFQVSAYIATFAFAMSLWFFLFRLHRDRERRTHYVRYGVGSLLLAIGAASAGAFWFHARWNWYGANEIGLFASQQSQSICVEAQVKSEPRWIVADENQTDLNAIPTVDRTRIAVAILKVRDGTRWNDACGRVDLIIHSRTDHVNSGDRIRVFGKLIGISGPTNPGQFDFREYFRSQSQFASLHALHSEAVVVIESAQRWSGARLLSTLRHNLNELTWKYVSPERAGLASAILLGNRSQLTATRRAQFLMTGTVHLLAISGLHVGILSGIFFFFYRIGLIRRKTFLISTILFVLFYAWLVEFRPPVSRAAILIVLLCIGRLTGHSSFSFNWLAFAGFIILLINPADLFQIGPQLSFLAVATITFGKDWLFWPPPQDPLRRLIEYTRPFHVRAIYTLQRTMRTAFLVSGLIWLVAMPLVAYRFHLLAPVALLVNPLLLLPIALALYGGLGVLVCGWFSPQLGSVFGAVCDWNLSLVEWLIGIANGLPTGHAWTAGPSTNAVFAFYVGLVFLGIFPKTRLSAKWFLLSILLWTVFGWWVPNGISHLRERVSEKNLVCTFADVGHGTGVLIQLPNGKNLLYDAGSFGSANYAARNVSGLLWHHGIEHLDAIVLSHADVDHFNAVPEICERFSVGVVYMSPRMCLDESPSVVHLKSVLTEFNVPIVGLAEGDRLLGTHAKIEVLGPPSFGTDGSDNSESIVLAVAYQEKTLLLTGDLESTGMQMLLAKHPQDVDILMAPHHGSMNSAPQDLMAWCKPGIVTISGSDARIRTDVEPVFAASGARIFRTDRDGAIRFEIGDEEVAIECYNDR